MDDGQRMARITGCPIQKEIMETVIADCGIASAKTRHGRHPRSLLETGPSGVPDEGGRRSAS